MASQPIDYDRVAESVRKNIHLLTELNSEEIDIDSLVRFNNRLILSDNIRFLEAVKEDIGGEILEDSTVGPFLHYGN